MIRYVISNADGSATIQLDVDIAEDGGTYARHDCDMAADYLGSKLGALAGLPRTNESFDDGYQWWHTQHDIRYCIRELAAWDTHCGATRLPTLLEAIQRATQAWLDARAERGLGGLSPGQSQRGSGGDPARAVGEAGYAGRRRLRHGTLPA